MALRFRQNLLQPLHISLTFIVCWTFGQLMHGWFGWSCSRNHGLRADLNKQAYADPGFIWMSKSVKSIYIEMQYDTSKEKLGQENALISHDLLIVIPKLGILKVISAVADMGRAHKCHNPNWSIPSFFISLRVRTCDFFQIPIFPVIWFLFLFVTVV